MTASFAAGAEDPSNSGVDNQSADEGGGRRTSWLTAGAVAVCLLLQLHLVFVQPINWDEFRFLADIHAHQRGELSIPLLTFQVHFFGWLTGIGNEIHEIRAGRLVMLALECGTLAFIWATARRFFAPAEALFAALGYVSFSFVLQHGASFRFDPIIAFLLMGAAFLLLRQRLAWLDMIVAGLALAAATMVSIKTALLLPLIVAVGAARLADSGKRRETFLRLLAAAISAALFLGLLYAWHVSTLAAAAGSEAQEHLAASYSKTLRDIPFFPRRHYLLRSVIENPVHWLLLLLGIAAVVRSYRQGKTRALLILAFLLPLLSIAVYRNAFPYYYALVLAPAAILFAAAASRVELRSILVPLAFVLAGGAILHHRQALSEATRDQERTVAAVHAMFPQPVAYLDRCSMIGSFPQAGMFLSTWWMENYLRNGRPVVREMLARSQPVFVIANSPFLMAALKGQSAAEMPGGFMADDRAVLHENYVHHWGPVWVAGKAIEATSAGTEAEFLVGGVYKLESRQPVAIDGRRVLPGEGVRIGPGMHRIATGERNERIILRWGTDLRKPVSNAPSELLFGRF